MEYPARKSPGSSSASAASFTFSRKMLLATDEKDLLALLRQWALASSGGDERAFKSFLVRAGIAEKDIDKLLAAFRAHKAQGAFDVDGFVRWLFQPSGSSLSSTRELISKELSQDDIYSVPLLPRSSSRRGDNLGVASWNVAAVNNNPFEYWITVDDPSYIELMDGVEALIDNPGKRDVSVDEVFTPDMFSELRCLMAEEQWRELDRVEELWNTEYRHLQIIDGFLKDRDIGAKRLISMPDRLTNTVNVVTAVESQYKPPPAFRPTVINNFEGDMSSVPVWWDAWKLFMFTVPLRTRSKKGIVQQRPCEMMARIPRAKYPALSEEEERVSVPLQVLCLAIFDAILVHIMITLSPDGLWQNLKGELCERLYRQKHRRIAEILTTSYCDVEVICLQEAAGAFVELVRRSANPLAESHHVILPEKLDGKRDQNSIILLRKDWFPLSSVQEVTASVLERLDTGHCVVDGDLLAITCTDVLGNDFLLVSFHGDTDGKLSIPVVEAINAMWKDNWGKDKSIILGLDANIYFPETAKGRVTIDSFMEALCVMGFTSCWGDRPDPRVCRTTCSARTFLQPQLNKAVRRVDRATKGDNSPKDIIVFLKDQYDVEQPPSKDNTGRVEYAENTTFPTPEFPSDHGILTAFLRRKSNPQGD